MKKISATCFLIGRREVMGYEVMGYAVMGYAVAQLEEALRYLPEGRAFDS